MNDTINQMGFVAASIFVVTNLMRLTSPQETAATEHAETLIKQKPKTLKKATSPQIGVIQYAPTYSALDPMVSFTSAAVNTTFDPSDDYWGLPRAAGVDEVASHCTACHSLQIVMQQRQTQQGWDYLLNWMVKDQGMAPMPDDTRATILSYLTTNFGVQN
ncbi:MAG: hypothetical protein HKP25_13290 [Marinicaulis sp.]|nr:hypothetical protein [Marinicaulis sp.]NNL90035.1 hypothetical protein [Marinicaulis sp.]